VWLSNDDLVISHADDSVISPNYVSQHWGTHYPHHQPGTTRFHDLPHAHTTHLLANGVLPKVASEPLGHSKAVAVRVEQMVNKIAL
jgi:integrase